MNTTLSSKPAVMATAQARKGDALAVINRRLDQTAVPHAINESFLEEILDGIQAVGSPQDAVYWLSLARLTEAALLCAGHYADNCEFRAAGDLLVNPRKIRVQVPGRGPSFIKTRHGRLTDQLAQRFAGTAGGPVDKREAACEIVAPALLPDLYRRLATSGYFTREYLDHVEACLTAVSATIAFLAAWPVAANEQLHQQLQEGSVAQRDFVEAHLCRFDTTWFWLLGRRIRQARALKGRGTGDGALSPRADRDAVLAHALRN